jgi:hypothetical protein
MTKKLMGVVILSACILALALPLRAATDAGPAPAVATVATAAPAVPPAPPTLPAAAPATAAPVAPAACALPAAASSEAGDALSALLPDPTPVCTFCNLSGYVNCESTDGTSCSSPGTHKRCYINPPCACEWGICQCQADNTWHCFW